MASAIKISSNGMARSRPKNRTKQEFGQSRGAATQENPGRKSGEGVEMKRESRSDGTLRCGREPASRYNQPFVRAIRAASTRLAAPVFEIASDK